MPTVPSLNSQSADPQPGNAPAKPAVVDPGVPSLQQIQSEIQELHDTIVTEYQHSPALQFVKQKLKEAYTGLDQEMRNLVIDAQLEANAARRKGSELLGRK